MIILISGATHTGKTALAQRLMEECKIPYFSIDHLKMGLIRSGQTSLTANDDEELTPYLWSIVREMIKTAIENGQSLIVEGCYIPFDWKQDFDENYLSEISYCCLVMTEEYVENHFSEILEQENVIEKRMISADVTKRKLIDDNQQNLELCKENNLPYVLIGKSYPTSIPDEFIKLQP